MAYELQNSRRIGETDVSPAGSFEMTPQAFVDLVIRVHERMLDCKDAAEIQRLSTDAKLQQAKETLIAIIREEAQSVSARLRQQIAEDVLAELSGYGPIQGLLEDQTITEIMVNGSGHVYVERGGKISKERRVFRDNAHVMRIIERIVLPLGRRIDESSPMVDARLPDGSRVNVIIPPLAIDGPTLTVRKFARVPYTDEDLIGFGTMTRWMANLFRVCVRAKINILISGGTGSGKTTTLNVLSSYIPEDERIVTIEDAAELQLQQEHMVRLESRPPNLEGKGEITIRQLVRNALRMRPDRIVVGEVRGAEALDMLQAMNTGHQGSLCTAHTNSPRDALSRLETLVLMAGMDLPLRAVREQIASAMNLIIHQTRLRDGSRRITHVSEVQGIEGDVIVLQDIVVFDQRSVAPDGTIIGEHKATGLRPKLVTRLEREGIELPADVIGHDWCR